MAVHKVLAIFESIDKISPTAKKIGGNLDKLDSVATKAGLAIASGLLVAGTAIVGLGIVSVKTAIEFESAWTGVVKTTDGLVDELGNLTDKGADLQQGFRDMAKEVPIAVEELLGIGELGGQLGIAGDDVLSFTETIAALGVATNLTTEDAATGLAQFSNVMGTTERIGSEAFERLGSTIVALGNNSATTEADILSFAQRIAGAGKIAGVTEADIFGIGAAFASVGIEAEAGGTAVQKVLLGVNSAVITGGKELEIYAKTAGSSAEDFAAAWKTDAGGAFEQFVTGLGKAGDDAIFILEDLGLQDQRLIKSFLSLASAGDVLTDSMDIANQGWEENVALSNEASQRYATTASRLAILKNVIKDVAIGVGSAFLPLAKEMIDWAAAMANQHGPALIRVFETVAGAISSAITELSSITSVEDLMSRLPASIMPTLEAIKDFAKVVLENKDAIIAAFTAIGRAISAALVAKKVAGIVKALTMLTSPIGIILALVGVLAFVWKSNLGGIQQKTAAVWKKLKPIFEQIQKWLQTNIPKALKKVQSVFAAVWGKIGPTVISVVNEIVSFYLSMFNMVVAWTKANMPLIQSVIEKTMLRVQEVVTMVLEFVSAFWEQHGESIINTVLTMWEVVKTIITTSLGVILSIITAVLQVLDGDWRAGWETIKATAENVWILIQSAIATALAFIKDTILPAAMLAIQTIMGTAWGIIQGAVTTVWDAIQAKIAEVWLAIQTAVGTAIEAVKTKIIEVLDSLGIEWRDNWEQIKIAAEIVWEALQLAIETATLVIQTIIETAMGIIQTVFETTWAAISTVVTTVSGEIQTAFGTAMDWLQTKAQTVWDAISSIFQDKVDESRGIVEGAADAFKSAGAAIVDALAQGISDAWGGVMDTVNSGLDALTDLLPGSPVKDPTSPLRKLPSAGRGIVTNLVGGMKSAMPLLRNELGNMLALPGLGDGGGGNMQLAGAGASASGGSVDRSTTNNYILNWQGSGGGGSSQDEAAGAMREIEVAAQLRR